MTLSGPSRPACRSAPIRRGWTSMAVASSSMQANPSHTRSGSSIPMAMRPPRSCGTSLPCGAPAFIGRGVCGNPTGRQSCSKGSWRSAPSVRRTPSFQRFGGPVVRSPAAEPGSRRPRRCPRSGGPCSRSDFFRRPRASPASSRWVPSPGSPTPSWRSRLSTHVPMGCRSRSARRRQRRCAGGTALEWWAEDDLGTVVLGDMKDYTIWADSRKVCATIEFGRPLPAEARVLRLLATSVAERAVIAVTLGGQEIPWGSP